MATLTYSNAEENRFWLQLLGDYALLIINGIPNEDASTREELNNTIALFDKLLNRARQEMTAGQMAQLNKDALNAVEKYRSLMLQILNLKLVGNYQFLLDSAYLNNVVTFADEYIFLLKSFINSKQPKMELAVQQDLFWLPRFMEIAKYISRSVGLYEKELKQRAEKFESDFTNLFLYAIELEGMARIGREDFPLMTEHRKNVQKKLQEFAVFLTDMYTLTQQNKTSGLLSPLYMDRTNRMVCYYLKHLAMITHTEPPACDPASPRLSNI